MLGFDLWFVFIDKTFPYFYFINMGFSE